jgi:raffinose/stachyose/melibiose transport system substrate-binding protein
MAKKSLLFLIAFLLAITSMVGCSSKANQKVNSEQAKVTITWMQGEPQYVEQYKNLVGLFHMDNPNITVQPQLVEDVSILKTKLNSGQVYDMFNTSVYADNSTYKDYILDLSKEACVKDISATALPSVTLDNKILGIPLDLNSYAFIYDKKAFQKAGITTLPKTLSELEQDCIKLKDAGIIPFGTGYKDSWILAHIFSYFMASNPGYDKIDAYSAIASGQKSFADVPDINDYFDLIDLTVKYSNGKPLDTGWEDIEKALASGKVAMIHMGVWCEDVLKQNNPNIDVGFMPAPVGDKTSQMGISSDIAWALRVYNKGKNISACKTFINWLVTSNDGKAFVPMQMGKIGAFKDAPTPNSILGTDAQKYISNGGKDYTWIFESWPSGFYADSGNIVQSYVAKQINRTQCIQQLTDSYKKFAKNSAT